MNIRENTFLGSMKVWCQGRLFLDLQFVFLF